MVDPGAVQPGPGPGGVLDGFALPLEGARMLVRERRLWTLALMPMALSLLAFATALALVIAQAGELYAGVTAWMPMLEATSWYAWLWVGPAWLLLRLLGLLAFLVTAAVMLVAAYLVASLVAAPFHDLLAQRVERLVTGKVRDDTEGGLLGLLREAGRALLGEARRLLFYISLVVPLALVGFVIPGAHLLTGPMILAITILFLPLDYASYTLDRRRVVFAQRRRWILDHTPVMVGFGGAAFLACCVPGINFAAMPILVVAGTLLALRLDPA